MHLDPKQVQITVEEAFHRFGKTRNLAEANEATTRCELIDVILTALGWKPPSLTREVNSQTGDWLDYELSAGGESWLVVEAKRAGNTFALDIGEDYGVRAISTLQRRGGANLRDALKQAAQYCNDRAIPFACVTNGYQWIFFRGLSRRSKSWTSERALIFGSADAVLEMFDHFLACLRRSGIGGPTLPRLLALPTDGEIPKAIVPSTFLDLSRERPSDDSVEQTRLGARLLFTEIHGTDRREMLRRCYISPGNEGEFRRSVRALLQDSSRGLAGTASAYESEVDDFVDRVTKLERSRGLDHPIVVAGHVGAGKTTFIHRSLEHFRDDKSPRYRTAFYAYVDLEGIAQGGKIETRREERRVAKAILERLGVSAQKVLKHWMTAEGEANETELKQADPFSRIALKTLLRHELKREYELGGDLWEDNQEKWEQHQYELIKEKADDHAELVFDFIRHLRGRFNRNDGLKFPILLVLDNLDQASDAYQRCIYGLASRLAKQTPAIVVVTLREDTYRRGLADNGFLRADSLEFVFHVAAPPLDRLVRRRTKFAKNLLADDSGIGTKEGWLRKMRKHSKEVVSVIQFADEALLERHNQGAEVIASLAGHNTRDALRLIRNASVGAVSVRSSPDGSAEFLLECLMAAHTSSSIEGESGIRRCFDATPHAPPMHLLRLRLLAYLSWARETDHRHAMLEATDALLARFGAWGYPVEIVTSELHVLIDNGLVEDVGDWSTDKFFSKLPERVAITVLGEEHLKVLVSLPSYRALMACLCRWYDPELAEEFIKRAQQAGGTRGVTLGDIVESTAPSLYDAYLKLASTAEDEFLSSALTEQEWVREVLSRSRLFRELQTKDSSSGSESNLSRDGQRARPKTRSPGQLRLFEGEEDGLEALPRIPRTLKWRGTCWIPRILWGLEFARRKQLPPQTASDLARILVAYGDIDVPAPNVARAFRNLRGEKRVKGLWDATNKRYRITDAGSTLICSLVSDVLEET